MTANFAPVKGKTHQNTSVTALCPLSSLNYPTGAVSEVRPTYRRAVPVGALPEVRVPMDAYEVFKEVWDREKFEYCEQVYLLLLNGRHLVHGWTLLGEGSLNHCHIYPQKVLTLGLITHSAGILLAHNHPSGSLDISEPDKAITKRIAESAKLVGLSLVDHLILASLDGGMVSLRGEYPHLFCDPPSLSF